MTQITFLMGTDGASKNAFYSLAAQYFAPRPDNTTIAPTAAQRYLTLEDVFATLTAAKPAPSVINIVSHAIGFGFMSFPLTRARRDGPHHEDSTGLAELTASDAPKLSVKGITGQAQVVIYGCDIGRSSLFVYHLAQLFGGPLQIFAPRRVAAFLKDGVVSYRLVQTWTVPTSALGHIPTDNNDPDWPAFHARFAAQADASFGPMATTAGGAGGRKQLQDLITAKATNQTYDQSGKSFFFTESVEAPVGSVTVSNPLENGDPPPPIYPPSAIAVDDTWVVTRLTDKDGVPTPGDPSSKDFTVVVLASIIETAVDFRDGFSFLSLYTAPQIAPQKPVPAGSPTGSASTPPGPSGDLGSLTDQLVAAGLAQAEIDPLLAALAAPAAEDDALVSADPDVPPTDDPDDDKIDQLLPIEDV